MKLPYLQKLGLNKNYQTITICNNCLLLLLRFNLKKIIMKTIYIAMVLLMASYTMTAQPNEKFMNLMHPAIMHLAEIKDMDGFRTSGVMFENLAKIEPKNWLPLYYQAYSYLSCAAKLGSPEEMNEVIILAENAINLAEKLSPENSEIVALKAMCIKAKIVADPKNEIEQNGVKALAIVELAKKLNPNNPRVYLIEAMLRNRLPEALGAGSKLTLPLLQKAEELFAGFKLDNPLSPNWGADLLGEVMKEASR
jgi:TPR repeat protein